MSVSDNEFKQYLNELNDIGTNVAWAQPTHGLHGCGPYQPFWDSNTGPAPKLCRDVITHYKLDPTIFSTPAVPLYTSRDFSHGLPW